MQRNNSSQFGGEMIREQGGEEGFRQEMEKWGEHLYLEGWDAGL